jgi:catechol 2,3-dioxygenase-like lactoylglutathione lyase family enzyme
MDEQGGTGTEIEAAGGDPSPVRVNKLGHLVYEVSDLEKTVKFWTEVMGFTLSDRNEFGMAFLRFGADHHAIALTQSKAGRRAAADSGLRVQHLAMEVDDLDMLFQARDWLRQHHITISFEGRRGPGCNYSLHVLDPDGFDFELYCDMDQIGKDGRSRPAEQFRRAETLEQAAAEKLPESW